jgi:hypothetical protein
MVAKLAIFRAVAVDGSRDRKISKREGRHSHRPLKETKPSPVSLPVTLKVHRDPVPISTAEPSPGFNI